MLLEHAPSQIFYGIKVAFIAKDKGSSYLTGFLASAFYSHTVKHLWNASKLKYMIIALIIGTKALT